jgi:uncharacterized LabA/DUF88 family protein
MTKTIQVFMDLEHVMSCQFASRMQGIPLRKEKLLVLDILREKFEEYEFGESSAAVRNHPLHQIGEQDWLLRTDRKKLTKLGFQTQEPQHYRKQYRCHSCQKVNGVYTHNQVHNLVIHEAMKTALLGSKGDLICIIGDDPVYRVATGVLLEAGYNAELWSFDGDKLEKQEPDNSWEPFLKSDNSAPANGYQIFWDLSHICYIARKNKFIGGASVPFDFLLAMQGISGGVRCGAYSSYYDSLPPEGVPQYMTAENKRMFEMNHYQSVQFPLESSLLTCESDDISSGCGHHWYRYREKDVDAALIIGMYQAAFALDQAHFVLVSTDSEFLPVVRALHQAGHVIDVWGFSQQVTIMSKRSRRGVHYLDLNPYLISA